MDTLQYINFVIANAFIMFAGIFFIMGLVLGLKAKNIRKGMQKHTNIIFIDTGEIFDFWGWGDIFSMEDADYVIDHHKIKGKSIFFDSRFAEPPVFESYNFDKTGIPNITFTPDMSRWLYWIDSKMFFRVFENKILEKMMQIQATDLIKLVLVTSIISCLIGVVSVYFLYQANANIGSIVQMVTDLYKTFKVG